MWRSIVCALTAFSTMAKAAAADTVPSDVAAEARAMLETLIAFPTVAGRGAVPKMAGYLAGELIEAGFDAGDIEIMTVGDSAALVARYRGAPDSAKKPVLFLAHMDVVEARREDWDHDPFALTEKDGVFYGRGVVDNKYGVLTLTQTFMRLKRDGFVPDRDLILAFSGDEETGMLTTRALASRLKEAAFAVNSDAGGGYRPADGSPGAYGLQAAEKTYATFEVTARNDGGHSSQPRADNAIYDLATALKRVEAHKFPPRWNAVSLEAFKAIAPSLAPDLRDAVERFVEKPGDARALKAMSKDAGLDRDLRTTCVATMLRAGHAENALPQSATATVNCRIFPGDKVEDVKATLMSVMANGNLEIATLGEPLESPVSAVPPEVTAAIAEVIKVRAPGAAISPYLEAGGTDGLHFRRAGVPTVGAGPIFSLEGDEYNYHGKNERLPAARFYEGLDHFMIFIKALAGGGPLQQE
ncbi:MAG: M20/M25/M40 family metallo-hydrolase [Parvularculaceae bacterium]|nr:M20/M25/M40 family metallo-hydrolase [Parvularculaceae bacterium]